MRKCTSFIKLENVEYDSTAGKFEKKITYILQGCERSVFVVDALSGITPSEFRVLVNALSEEGGFYMDDAYVSSTKLL